MVIFNTLSLQCITSEAMQYSCRQFCSRFQDKKLVIYPIGETHICQNKDILMNTHFLIENPRKNIYKFYISVSLSYPLELKFHPIFGQPFNKFVILQEHRNESFLYWEDKELNNLFNFYMELPYADVEIRMRELRSNQSENSEFEAVKEVRLHNTSMFLIYSFEQIITLNK